MSGLHNPYGQQRHAAERAEEQRILIVDDSASQRATISAILRSWGYEVVCARNGTEGLELFRTQPISIVVSDWNMPGLTGTQLCAEMRALGKNDYIYFILMTSRTDKRDIVEGLNAGADDYLAKPVDAGELLARLKAGERILSLQHDLRRRHDETVSAHNELKRVHAALEDDLALASKVQMLCVPPAFDLCGSCQVSSIYQPCSHVSGDLIGYFELNEDEIAAYSVDVSGHGVAAALMSFSLSQTFRSRGVHGNVAVERLSGQTTRPLDPKDVVARLNQRYQNHSDTDQYFTMAYVRFNTKTGSLRFCQAGHPPPAIIRHDGQVEFKGDGGLPVGLLPDVSYADCEIQLSAGDKLVLYSDGLTDCEGQNGHPLGEDGLADLLAGLANRPVETLAQDLKRTIMTETHGRSFPDDVSALIFAQA